MKRASWAMVLAMCWPMQSHAQDAGVDAGTPDAGVDASDAGTPDAGVDASDAGTLDAGAGKSPACQKRTIEIKGQPKRILARPSELPPSRMVLSFDSNDGEHRAVEWDALVSTRLGRVVVLPVGTWQVSVWSQPIRNPHDPTIDVAWTGDDLIPEDGQCKMELQRRFGAKKAAILTLKLDDMPTLRETIEALSSTAGGKIGGAIVPDARALGPVPDFVQDLGATMAATIVKRGRASLEAVVRDLLVDACFAVKVQDSKDVSKVMDSEEVSKGAGQSRTLLPNSCRALDSLRLDTLASAGTVLRDALLADLMDYSMEWAMNSVLTSLEKGTAEEGKEVPCFALSKEKVDTLVDVWKHIDLEALKNDEKRSELVTKFKTAFKPFVTGDALKEPLNAALNKALEALKTADDTHVAEKLSLLRVALVRAQAVKVDKDCLKASGVMELVRQVQKLVRQRNEGIDTARALVSAFAGVVLRWKILLNSELDPTRPRTALMLAFANASYCLATGGCETRQIEDLTRNPEKVIGRTCPKSSGDSQMVLPLFDSPQHQSGPSKSNTCSPTKKGDNILLLGETVQLTRQLLDVLSNQAGSKRDTNRTAVDIAYTVVSWTLLDGLLTPKEGERGTYARAPEILMSSQSERTSACAGYEAKEQHACMSLYRLESTRKLAHAAIDKDAPAALTAAVRLVESSEYFAQKLRRFARLVGPVVAYVRTYEKAEGGSEHDATARQAAREAAFEALIDAASDRSEREGAHIFSLGGALLLQRGRTVQGNDGGQVQVPFALPVGLAYDWLPTSDRWVGLHLQLSFLDVGVYSAAGRDTDIQWSDILLPALDFGFSFGGRKAASTPPWLGLRLGFGPSLVGPETDSEAVRDAYFIGAALGAYVPFFDFN